MNENTHDASLEVRPAREALLEIFALSLVALLLTACVGFIARPSATAMDLLAHAPVVGAAVVDHIGWAFSVYVPVLLGFYVVIVGGQLAAPKRVAALLRRRLGFVAEAMVAALMPAVTLVIAASTSSTTAAGALVVVLPATALTVFLAVQLGGFIVFEPELQITANIRTRDWALSHLSTVKHRSRRPVLIVILFNAAVAGAASTATTMAFFLPLSEWMTPLLVLGAYSALAFVLCMMSVGGSFLRDTASDGFSRSLGWILIIGPYVMLLAALIHSALTVEPIAPLGFVILGAAIASSIVWPTSRRTPRFILNWTLHGASSRLAARSIVSSYRISTTKLRELTPIVRSGEQRPLLQRLRDAWNLLAAHQK